MIRKIQEKFKNVSSHKAFFVLIYTIFWLLLAGLILLVFYRNDKIFLWDFDGVYQHFSSFNYLIDYLKDFIYNFHFSGFFNFTLGQGMDVLTTLNSYDFTDPISILCALVFPLSRVGRYTLMIFIKLYLVGISFLFYCYAIEKQQGLATIGGALAYVFCGAVLFMFARHPNYINWAYFFPFLLGGVELYLRKKKKLPLILFVFLNLITSYYTFYMNFILVAIYVIVQVICKAAKEKSWETLRKELIKCLKLLGVCCIGVLLSSVILFPTIYAYLNNNRLGELTGYTASALHYESEYYKNVFESIFEPFRYGEYTSYIGINAVLIIPLALIFIKRKQYTSIKVLYLLSLLMLGIPVIGRIMNGFGYATNRWAYAIPFYASVIFVFMFSEIENMTEKEKAFVLLVIISYIGLCYMHSNTNTDALKSITLIVIVLITASVFIALQYKYPRIEPFVFSLVILGAGFQIYGTFSVSEGNYVNEYLDETKATTSYTDYSSSVAANASYDKDFYRVEMEETITNVNGVNNVNGTGFYWSMISGDMMDYYTDLGIEYVENNCKANGLDGRTGLLELAGVKYYTRPAKEEGLVPYGYKEIPSRDERYQIFENEYALPIGYTYTDYISSSEYEKLNGIEKEQALLQAAVLDEDINGFSEANVEFDYECLDYKITKVEGAIFENNQIIVTDTNGSIDFQVMVPENYEIYIYIPGIELGDSVDHIWLNATRTKDECSISKSSTISNLTYSWPVIRSDVAFNLGSGYTGENTITLSFDKICTLSFDNIQIIAVPMSVYKEYAEALGEYVLEDVEVEEDYIKGIISLPEARILQFSVPYSDGWKAYVDGEEVSVMKSDVMYMAIPLSSGNHTIELRYETPYLRFGVIVTIVTAVLYAAYEIIRYRKNKGVQKNG